MSVRVRNVSPFVIGIDVPGVGHVPHLAEVDVPEAVAGRPASEFRPVAEDEDVPAHLTRVVVDEATGEEHTEVYDPGEGLLSSPHWELVTGPVKAPEKKTTGGAVPSGDTEK